MNLIDAIKSGKPYRRPDYAPGWQFPDSIYSFAHVDIVADDWEIQEPTVTITREKFWAAVQSATNVRLGTEIALDYAAVLKLAYLLGVGDKP